MNRPKLGVEIPKLGAW